MYFTKLDGSRRIEEIGEERVGRDSGEREVERKGRREDTRYARMEKPGGGGKNWCVKGRENVSRCQEPMGEVAMI